jgi:hypothetical protein
MMNSVPPAQERYRDSGQRPVTFCRDNAKGQPDVEVLGTLEALATPDRGRFYPATHRITMLFVPDVQKGDALLFHGSENAATEFEVVRASDPFAPTAADLATGAVATRTAAAVPGQFRIAAVAESAVSSGIHPDAGKFLTILCREV